ncbi:MAG: hypothetical protein R3E01_02455 [Pirellulaceae bacterium]
MLTIPRDRSTVDSIQDLLSELFGARDTLGAAAEVLADADDRYICRKLSFQLGGYAADLQQIVSASGVQPAGPRSDHDARQSLSSIQKHIGPNGVLDTAEQTEQMLTEKYEQTMGHLNDPEVTGLLERQREDVEFGDRILRRLKASA